MKTRFLAELQIDKIIKKRFDQKLMNNSKWRKVCALLLDQDENEIYLFRFKLVHENEDRENAVHTIESDFRFNWLIEPRLYKEVEYLEIPRFYEREVFKNTFETVEQPLESLFQKLLNLGQLPIELTKEKIKLTAYK